MPKRLVLTRQLVGTWNVSHRFSQGHPDFREPEQIGTSLWIVHVFRERQILECLGAVFVSTTFRDTISCVFSRPIHRGTFCAEVSTDPPTPFTENGSVLTGTFSIITNRTRL